MVAINFEQLGICRRYRYKSKDKINIAIVSIIKALEIKFNFGDLFIVPDKDSPLYNKFKKAKNALASKYGDIVTIYKILEKYRSYEKDSSKADFCYKYFIKKNILDKVLDSYKSIYKYKNKFKDANLETNKQVDLETNKQVDLETKDKIIQSFLFGYRYNILVKGKNKDKM